MARKPKKRTSKRRWLAISILILVALPVGIDSYVILSGRGRIYTSASWLPDRPVGIVFGAGLAGPDFKQPSWILQTRLDAAIELYKTGKVRQLLMSGDNRTADYNEPRVMRDYAIGRGVASKDISLDYGGRDTYDTCYRARHLFGVSKAILVTQEYHAPRAVFVARGLDLDVVAYATPNLNNLPRVQFGYDAREYIADLKAWWDVEISHRRPYVDSMKL
jgi:vancomycin permeability regulator SanA